MSEHTQGVTVDPTALIGFTGAVLRSMGLSDEDADAAADVLARTSIRGVESHGVWFLGRYVTQLREGGADPKAQISAVVDRPSLVVLDGGGGHGPAVAANATRLGIERARAHGQAMVAVRNGNHFGAAGHYALMCAEAGCIGMMMSNTGPIMAATGARSRSIGNNPLGFGAPRPEGVPPFVLDIAMSRVAGGKIRMALEQHQQVPLGWILDPDGRPTTSPEDFLVHKGALLPMEGHKGYGLALLVETLAGALSGAAMVGQVGNWLYTPDHPTDTGYFLMVIDVGEGSGFDDFQERMRAMTEEITAAPLAEDAERILIPGELEDEHERRAYADGLHLRGEVWTALQEVAATVGLETELRAIVR